jgi:hypothetical protein
MMPANAAHRFSIPRLFTTLFSGYNTPHQIRKRAIGAKRVGLVAEVVNDLQQTLLAGGGF